MRENFSSDKTPEEKEELIKLNLDFYVTDHSPDNADTGNPEELKKLYEDIKEDGIESIRYDWRWNKIEPQQNNWQEESLDRYEQAIELMKEAKLNPPTIVLSNIPDWALELYKKDKEEFFDAYRQYIEKIKDRLMRASSQTGELVSRIQVLNELNNTVYTPIESEDISRLCAITREVLREYDPSVKLLGTVFAGNLPGAVKTASLGKVDLGIPAEDYLEKYGEMLKSFDAIAVDYYPGTWHLPLAEALTNKKEMFEQLSLLREIMQKLAITGQEYELGEIGLPTSMPFLGEKHNEDRQRYFYDTFFRAFKKMLVDFAEQNIPLPTRIGLYQARDPQPATSAMGKVLDSVNPEKNFGLRDSEMGRKEILKGNRHVAEKEDRGPSQLSQIINYLNAPVKRNA